jgi:ABC-2 type transport system permease protein
MRQTFLVLKHELVTTILRRSFLLTLILLPLGGFIITLIISALQNNEAGQNIAQIFSGPPPGQEIQGFVDPGGLIQSIPEAAQSRLIEFDNPDQAADAMAVGKINAYYLISSDYIETGDVKYVRPDFNPLGGLEQTGLIESVLNENLLTGNPDLVARVRTPAILQVEYLTAQPQRDPSSALTFFLPCAVTFLFYIVIMSASSLLLSSITREKQNRVIEVLLTSIRPVEMLTGKIISLGLVGLLQTVVWGSAGLLLLRLSGRSLNISAAFQLPISILLWGILFFLLGYAVYASLMAGVGALVPNLREASQATTLIIFPMLVPLMMISALIQQLNSILSVILSIFPFSAPVAMMTRLAATSVPFWQLALATILMAATALLIIRSVSRMFHAQTLLSGQPFKLGNYLRALAGKS